MSALWVILSYYYHSCCGDNDLDDDGDDDVDDDDGDDESDDDGDEGRGSLIIIDDLMSDAYNSQVVNDIFSKGRHRNISIILVLQSYFPAGSGKSLIPQIKNNATIQIFF